MEFGVHTGLQNTSIGELQSLWGRIEDHGFDWISIWDHFYAADGTGNPHCLEAVASHAALAASTSRVRCGSLVYSVGYRHPAILANTMATLDQLSNGRITFGLGAGWLVAEYEAYGIEFPDGPVRLRQVEEAIQCIRGLLTQEVTSFDGEFFTLTGARCEPKPVQARLPLWIGGGGEKVTLRIAARHADGWNAAFISPADYGHKAQVLERHCADADRDPATIQKTVNTPLAWDESDLQAQFGKITEFVKPSVLTGSTDEVVDKVGAYRDAGAEMLVLAMRAPFDVDGLDRFAAEVLPQFRVIHELRLDPLTREWVTIVADRQDRPNLAPSPSGVDGCPFCVGGTEAPEPYTVRAFENRWPAFTPGAPIDPDAALAHASGFTALPARGAAEVVLYSPEHTGSLATIGVDGVRAVVDLWADRTAALLARPEVAYVLVFENRGTLVGATIPHPHGQIYAFPFVPPVPRREAEVANEHGCQVCAAVADERADATRVVHENETWLTYVPYASAYPYGTVLAPTAHVADLPSLDGPGRDGLADALVDVVGRYDRCFDAEMPYLMWVHPGVHLHVHFAPPLRAPGVQRYVASGEVGSGTYGNPVAPEAAAETLRRM